MVRTCRTVQYIQVLARGDHGVCDIQPNRLEMRLAVVLGTVTDDAHEGMKRPIPGQSSHLNYKGYVNKRRREHKNKKINRVPANQSVRTPPEKRRATHTRPRSDREKAYGNDSDYFIRARKS